MQASKRLVPPPRVIVPDNFLLANTRLIDVPDFIKITAALNMILGLLLRITPDENAGRGEPHKWSTHSLIKRAQALVHGVIKFED